MTRRKFHGIPLDIVITSSMVYETCEQSMQVFPRTVSLMYISHAMSAYCFIFICFDSFSYHRVEIKYFESYPPVTLAGNKGSKLVFLKEKSLNVMLTASGKTLHS